MLVFGNSDILRAPTSPYHPPVANTNTEPCSDNQGRIVCVLPCVVSFSFSAGTGITMTWMRSSRVVRASDCQCRSRNSPRFDPSILWHSGVWRAADEAVLNKVTFKKSPKMGTLGTPSKRYYIDYCVCQQTPFITEKSCWLGWNVFPAR